MTKEEDTGDWPRAPVRSIEIHRKTPVARRNIVGPGAASDVSTLLAHHLAQIVDGRLVRPAHPVPHRGRQRPGAVGLALHGRRGGAGQHVLAEAVAPVAAVGRGDGGRAVTALLEADVAVRGGVVARADLELGPRGRQLAAALHPALEAFRQADESLLAGTEGGRVGGVVEIGAGRAAAVPEVVVEIALLLLGRSVGQDDAGPGDGLEPLGGDGEGDVVGSDLRECYCGVVSLVAGTSMRRSLKESTLFLFTEFQGWELPEEVKRHCRYR